MRSASSRAWQPALITLGAIIMAAAVLRLLFLDRLSFTYDEGASVWIARLPWREFLKVLASSEANMALYYTLLRYWLVFGHSEFFIRSLSVIFSVGTIPVVYALGARMFGVRVGLIASLLVCFNAFDLEFAQTARSYSLVTFLASLASVFFVAAIEQSTKSRWIAYVATIVLAVYSHVLAAFILVAHWVSLVFLRPRDVPWKALVISTVIIGVLILPYGIFTLVGQQNIGALSKPTRGQFVQAFIWLSGRPASVPGEEGGASLSLRTQLILAAYIVFGAVAVAAASMSCAVRGLSRKTWYYGLLFLWLFVPIVSAYCISLYFKPIFGPQYWLLCLPALALLAAIGLSNIRPRHPRDRRRLLLGILIAVISLACSKVIDQYEHAVAEDWRGATHYVLANVQPGDTVVFYALGQWPFEYYRGLSARPDRQPLPEYVFPYDATQLFATGKFTLAPMQDFLKNAPRVWLVLSHDDVVVHTRLGPLNREILGNEIQKFLARRYPVVNHRDLLWIRVQLYSTR